MGQGHDLFLKCLSLEHKTHVGLLPGDQLRETLRHLGGGGGLTTLVACVRIYVRNALYPVYLKEGDGALAIADTEQSGVHRRHRD